MSFSHAGGTHKQQAAIRWKLVDQSLRREQRIVLRASARAFETLERTTRVTRRNAGSNEQSFEAIGTAAGTRQRAFHRIDFGAGAKAFCANLCILRRGELSFVYQVITLGTPECNRMIPYNARAVKNRMFY
jgi:hypothetical protein